MAKAMRYFVGTVQRETEKAVLVNFAYSASISTDEIYTTDVWLPKSQIEVYHQFSDGDKATVWKVPTWLCNKNHLSTVTKKVVDSLIER